MAITPSSPVPIPAQRRTLAIALDDTCERITDAPPIPVNAMRNAAGSGFIVIQGMERWRLNADGSLREYVEWKMPEERIQGKSPYKRVWWED